MSKHYLIEKFSDIERTLIPAIADYFNTLVGIKTKFPNFGTVQVSETHPFAIINVALANGQKEPGNLFPSITVSAVDDAIGAALLNLETDIVEIDADWLDDQLGNDLINDSEINTLKAIIATEHRNLFGVMTVDRYEQRLAYATWSEHREVRSYLYTHLRAFIMHNKDLFLSLGFENFVLTGTPSGLYNLDFGRILYGAELTLTGQRHQANIMVDTAWVKIEEVDMYIQNILSS